MKMMQSPSLGSAAVGHTVTTKFQVSQSIGRALDYQQQPRPSPQPLIYYASSLTLGIPAGFSINESGTQFTLTISGVQADDAATYYCFQG